MGEKIGVPLQFKGRAEVKSGPTAQRSQERLQADQQHESDAKGKEQVAIKRCEHLVHGELQEQRADDGKYFQSGSQNKDLRQRALKAGDAANEIAQTERTALFPLYKAGRGSKFQRNPSEVAAGFSKAD